MCVQYMMYGFRWLSDDVVMLWMRDGEGDKMKKMWEVMMIIGSPLLTLV